MAAPKKISERLEGFVSPEDRSLARAAVHAGRVQKRRAEPGLISAVVEDSGREWEVIVRLDGSAFSFDCRCALARQKRVCRHVYAGVLLAEAMALDGFRVRQLRQGGDDASDAGKPEDERGGKGAPDRQRRRDGTARGRGTASAASRSTPRSPSDTKSSPPQIAGTTRLFEIGGLERDGRALEVRLARWWRTEAGELVHREQGWDSARYEQADAETARVLQVLAACPLEGLERGRVDAATDTLAALRDGASVVVEADEEAHVAAAALATSRAVIVVDSSGERVAPERLSWSAEPWRLTLRVAPGEEEGQGGYRIEALLRRGAESRAIDDAEVVTRGGLVRFGADVAPLEPPELAGLARALREHGGQFVPDAEIREYLQRLWAFEPAPECLLPPELKPEERADPATGLWQVEDDGPDFVRGRLRFRSGGVEWDATESQAQRFDAVRWQWIARDARREREICEAALAALRSALESELEVEPDGSARVPRAVLTEVVSALEAAGIEVWTEAERLRSLHHAEFVVSSGMDWFDVEGRHDFGGGQELSLPEVLRALEHDRNRVRLQDGSIGLLSGDWWSKGAGTLQWGGTAGDALRFSRAMALGVQDLLDCAAADPAFVRATADTTFQRVQERLAAGARLEAIPAPSGFVGELRPYQHECLGWLRFLAELELGGILADDMGLGKTVQVLAHVWGRRADSKPPSLVVAPRSVVHQWVAEAERFTPQLRVVSYSGPGRKKLLDTGLEKFDLVVTSYGVVRRDAELLAERSFDVVVLDEAQAVKNAETDTARAVRRLPANQRLVVTGTPVENHLRELFAHLDFCNPGLFGPGNTLRQKVSSSSDPEALQEAARALAPLILRRTKAQVARDLPERIEQDLLCEMDAEQRRLYDELRKYFAQSLLPRADKEGMGKMQMHVLEALLRLRQVACHPELVEGAEPAGPHGPGTTAKRRPSAKFDVLLPRLEELVDEGGKALVFSQFTKFLGLLREELRRRGIEHEYLDGSTTDRPTRIQRFQEDPDCKLFLISLKAGGFGLNLTAAQYVFLLDPWWNPAVEAQAIDRAHRHGQTQKVIAYRLLTRDTVEEKIRELQHHKREVADAILNADSGGLRALDAEDLRALLG